MKKLLTILLLSATLTNAQTDYIKVLSVTDTVTTGDSITIKFTMKVNNGSNHMSQLQLWTSTYLQDCMYIASAFLSDTNIVKVAITPAMGSGNARIYSNAGPYAPFYIKSIVGIVEYDKSEIESVKYYDILGNEKAPTNESLYIKITAYSNGYLKKEKVIIQ